MSPRPLHLVAMAAERTVIVGSGHAGVEVAAALRDLGDGGEIHLVGDEPILPYQRPPLSKSPQRDDGATLLPLRPASFYRDKDVRRRDDVLVTVIDRPRRRVVLSSGEYLAYDRLVLALGAVPRRPSIPGVGGAGVHVLRTFAESCALWGALESARSLVVIGGGFLGLEFAAAAREHGVAVTVIEIAPRLLSGTVSAPVAAVLARAHVESGVDLVLEDSVRVIDRAGRDGRALRGVTTATGREVEADLVLVAVGARPRTGIALAAALEVDDGIVVDASMRTSDPAIFAVGDCARVRRSDGCSRRFESVANAVAHARTVARHITGAHPASSTPLWFWSRQGGSMLQIAGVADHDHDVVVHPGAPGEIRAFRFRGDDLTCVETVNRPRDHVLARRLLAQTGDGARRSVSRADVADPSVDLRQLLESADLCG